MLIVGIIALALGLGVVMALAWALVIASGKSGWVDVAWSYAIGIGGVVAALLLTGGAPLTARAWIVAALVALWALRLGTHILLRTLRGGDDPRYAKLREQWGSSYRMKLLGFLEIQAAVALLLDLAVLAAARNPAPLGFFDGLGVLVALAGISGEGLSDAQLARFVRDPANKGRICDVGLWSLSRHPNYFFEWLGWIAYPLIALGYGWGLVAWVAPVLMYVLLVHISGVPPLEAHMQESRPEAFAAYRARVRAFWPLPRSKGERA